MGSSGFVPSPLTCCNPLRVFACLWNTETKIDRTLTEMQVGNEILPTHNTNLSYSLYSAHNTFQVERRYEREYIV